MAVTCIPRSIVRLFIIITAVSLNNDTVRNIVIVSAKHVVQPLWDVSTNFSDSCILGDRNGDEQLFTGSPGHTCSLLVNASEGTRIQLQMHGLSNDFEIDSYMYAERVDEEPGRCSDKYTVFNDLSEPCMADIAAGDIQIILYGAASMTISGIPAAAGALPPCSEDAQGTMGRTDRVSCKDIRRYSDMIVCGKRTNLDSYFKDDDEIVGDVLLNIFSAAGITGTSEINDGEENNACVISFETNCDVILGPREAAYDCRINNEEQNSSMLIPFPNMVFQNYTVEMKVLLLQNRITKLNTGWAHGLDELLRLVLTLNSLHSLHQGVFAGLVSLKEMNLTHNQISDLEPGCFIGLRNLTELFLNDNILSSLHEGVFTGLVSLKKLYLHRNQISDLESGCFVGLSNLTTLYLDNNLLSILHEGVFTSLVSLTKLPLFSNRISNLESGCFLGLGNLTELFLNFNLLSILHEGVFTGLVSLKGFCLNGNQISHLKSGCFIGLGNLTTLYLDNNLLSILREGVFTNTSLVSLELLSVTRNRISHLESRCFHGLNKLAELYLDRNFLSILHEGVFTGFISMNTWANLNLEHNLLSILHEGVFAGLVSLEYLLLNSNQISDLNARSFQGLNNLRHLFLDDNLLHVLPQGMFTDLVTLQYVSLASNQLSDFNSLHKGLFAELNSLEELLFSRNHISRLYSGCFQGLIKLKRLFLDNNELRTLYENVFTDLIKLEELHMKNNPLTFITQKAFSYLPLTLTFLVSQHEICECFFVPKHISCYAEGIKDPYFTCDRLLSEKALAVFTWLIGFIILGGNLFVLIWKYKENAKNKVNSTLLVNLAISDSLMGIYMLILGSADAFFGDFFPMYSSNWRSGVTCRIAGALSIISSEASVLFIMLISIDRVICIRYPFSTWKLTPKSVRILLGVSWFFATVLGIVPSVLAGTSTKFYDNSHVCIGIPLALDRFFVAPTPPPIFPAAEDGTMSFIKDLCLEEYRPVFGSLIDLFGIQCDPTLVEGVGSFYSTTLFIGLNSLCFLVILVCYIGIVSAVRKSAKRSNRSLEMDEQIRLTSKVTSIIATDFCCWFPIILLGILVQIRVISLPASVFAWCITIVLRINSALNPFVYTVPDSISQYRKYKKKRSEEQQRLEENARKRKFHKSSEI